MNSHDCLSLTELLDARDGTADADTTAHLRTCTRCQTLLAALPEVREPAPLTPRALTGGVVRPEQSEQRPTTGTLWRAFAPQRPDVSWLVAVIGRAPDAEDRLVVAAVHDEPELALEGDLLLDPDSVGYPAFIDVNNLGVLLTSQLDEPVGKLIDEQAQWLVALYRSVIQGAAMPQDAPTGVPVRTDNDPRLLAADEREEHLRALWRSVDALVDGADEEAPAEAGETLALLLEQHVFATEAEWDLQTLLEVSHADGGRVQAFFADRLDLTDKRDVDDLARVLRTLDIDFRQASPFVWATLTHSPGGSRRASGPSLPMAARSQAGVDADEVTRQLYADRSDVDTSQQARKREAESYLAELERALDELS